MAQNIGILIDIIYVKQKLTGIFIGYFRIEQLDEWINAKELIYPTSIEVYS